MRLVLLCMVAPILVGCGEDAASDKCPGGVCIGIDSGLLDDGGRPLDDGGIACVEAWLCTPWDSAGNGDTGSRTCTDQNSCGTTDQKPTETATLPGLDIEYYECNVEPILTRGCSMLGCHGTETDRPYRIYARGRLRVAGQVLTEPNCSQAGMQFPSEVCIGSIECMCWSVQQFDIERQRSFDSARGFALDTSGTLLSDMADSELLRQPQTGGGFSHAGVSLWAQGNDDYREVKQWLEGASRGSACNSRN